MRSLSSFPATAASAFPATAALAALALSPGLAHGQVSHVAATRGSCTVTAIGGGSTGSHVVPAGTDVSEGLHVATLSGAGDSLAALDVSSSAGELQVFASCVPMWPGAQAQVSRAEVIMQISTPAAVSGRLLLEVEVTLGGSSASGIAGIDVDDDGVDDISSSSGAQQLTLNRNLGPTPIAVRLHVEGFGANVDHADVRARVRAEGPPARFVIAEVNRQGFGCPYNALRAWGDSRNRGVWLQFPLGGVFAIGPQRGALLLQPACWLNVVPPAAVVPAPASQVMVPTPAALQGTVFVQAFGVLDGRLQGSNTMLVSLQ